MVAQMNHSTNTFRLIRVAPEQFKDVNILSYFKELVSCIDRHAIGEFSLERKFSDKTVKYQEILGKPKLSVSKRRDKGSGCKNWIRVAKSYGLLFSPPNSTNYSIGLEGNILKNLVRPTEEELKENPRKLSEEEKIFFLYVILKKDGDHFLALLKSVKEARDEDELRGEFNPKYNEFSRDILRQMWTKKGSDVVLKWGTFQRNIIATYALHAMKYGRKHEKREEYFRNIIETPCWKGEGTRVHRTEGRMGFAEDLGLKKKGKLELTNEGEKLIKIIEKSEEKNVEGIDSYIIDLLRKNRIFAASDVEILDKKKEYYLFNLSGDYLNQNAFSIIQKIFYNKTKLTFEFLDFINTLHELFDKFSHPVLLKMGTGYLPYYSIKTLAKTGQTVAEFSDIISSLNKSREQLVKYGYNFEWSSRKNVGWLYKT